MHWRTSRTDIIVALCHAPYKTRRTYMYRMDKQGLGFVSIDDFTQLLNSRDLGLQLNENELLYIAEQVDPGNGWVPFVPVAQQLPEFLVAMYNQRAELQMVSVPSSNVHLVSDQ